MIKRADAEIAMRAIAFHREVPWNRDPTDLAGGVVTAYLASLLGIPDEVTRQLDQQNATIAELQSSLQRASDGAYQLVAENERLVAENERLVEERTLTEGGEVSEPPAQRKRVRLGKKVGDEISWTHPTLGAQTSTITKIKRTKKGWIVSTIGGGEITLYREDAV